MTKKSSIVSILPLLLVLGTSPAVLAQGTSTQEERAHWVDITHKLESNPLDVALNKEAGESAEAVD